jgi:hypothetical protein
MTVYFYPNSSIAAQAAAVKAILRGNDPQFVRVALSGQGITNYSINSDGAVFNAGTGAFLTDAQLAALWPSLPHEWGGAY